MSKTTRKVAHLTSAHPRFDTRIFLKECTSLAANDHYVSLVVADGKGNEQKNGIAIYDVGASKGRLGRIFFATRRVYKKAVSLNADLYHLHDPELIPIGLKLKRQGKRVIFDIHENTDLQILEKKWIPYILRRSISFCYSKYEVTSCRRFDALVVPQVSMEKKYSRYAKTFLIANFPVENINSTYREGVSKFNIIYAGGLSEPRGLLNMLDLITSLSKIDSRYKLTLAGSINNSDLERVKKHPGWSNTLYLGLLSKERLYEEYSKNSIGLILFNNVGQYHMSYSLKLFEYMQLGLTIFMPNFGDWLSFNASYGVGFNVDTKNSVAISEIIHSMTEDSLKGIARHNIGLLSKEFLWETQEKKLIELYRVLLSGGTTTGG